MASFFDSCVELKVLRFFLTHPNEKVYVKQLARLLGISSGSASLCCKSLLKKRLLCSETAGRALFYWLNKESAVALQLGRAAIAEAFANSGALKEFAKEEGLVSVAVYGSFARMDFDEKSDLDLLVVSNSKSGCEKAVKMLERGFKREVSVTALAPHEWSELSEKRDLFFFNVLSDHILLYGSKLAV